MLRADYKKVFHNFVAGSYIAERYNVSDCVTECNLCSDTYLLFCGCALPVVMPPSALDRLGNVLTFILS